MPGMMDTVLNLGLNDATVEALATNSGDKRFAHDSYRRFITMYSDVVFGLGHHHFEEILDDHKDRNGYTLDTDLTTDDWVDLVGRYKERLEDEHGAPFPQDPHEQLWGAISAVFESWMNQRAITYRRLHGIPESWGTAVNVQSMVFGNMGETSATGVAFTRNPSTGENRLYGEFLINAQGEDVVAGIRTPQALTRIAREEMGEKHPSMEEALPEVFVEFKAVAEKLETHYRDRQDIEFPVEKGRLYMLQTRNGKRTAKAALKVAVDLANEKLITREEAVMRVEPASLDQLLHPTIDPASNRDVIATGLPASPGAATGKIVFTAAEAEIQGGSAGAVILVREETSPEDIRGMDAARGIVTARGGMTSHAAVVARGMGRPCVSGAGEIHIDAKAGEMRTRGRTFRAGDVAALAKILPMQRDDFVELFGIMEGLPVTIRLLDPPLHEFLPHTEEDVAAVAAATGLDAAKLLRRTQELHEVNPMLGHRGCRLGVAYPEIYEMQVRAIIEAACEIAAQGKPAPIPEIMHPLVAKGEEMKFLKGLTDRTARAVMEEKACQIDYKVGTMVELPRAAIRAGDLAENAEFFSFGTNDLTQTTFGISRDDSGRFLNAYIDKGIFEKDPFVSLDQEGVGDLIRIAAERGRAVRPDVKLGICGEHGGDPASIAFCEAVGLDYVSCSPYRVPIARLAAAQAALQKT